MGGEHVVNVRPVGDMDGDGRADFLVGASSHFHELVYQGAVYVVTGPVSASRALGDGSPKILGAEAYDVIGVDVDGGADVHGDGWNDVLVGVWHSDQHAEDGGAVYLVEGPVEGNVQLGAAHLVAAGAEEQARVGKEVRFAGDTDGDGKSDLLVAGYRTPLGEEEQRAEAWLILGGGW